MFRITANAADQIARIAANTADPADFAAQYDRETMRAVLDYALHTRRDLDRWTADPTYLARRRETLTDAIATIRAALRG